MKSTYSSRRRSVELRYYQAEQLTGAREKARKTELIGSYFIIFSTPKERLTTNMAITTKFAVVLISLAFVIVAEGEQNVTTNTVGLATTFLPIGSTDITSTTETPVITNTPVTSDKSPAESMSSSAIATGMPAPTTMTSSSESNTKPTVDATDSILTRDVSTSTANGTSASAKADSNIESMVTTTATVGTDSSLVIIVGATAAIIIVIVLITAICLCCICSRNVKSPRESDTDVIMNGVHKEQEIKDLEKGANEEKVNGKGNKYISNNEADVYEDTDGMDVESSDEKKPAEPDKPNGTEVYSNQIYTDDEGKSETKRQSLRSDSTNEETGNIFEKVDPAVDSTDEMELTPKIVQPNDDVTNEEGEPEKSETREPAPRSGLKRNISNRKENVLHQLKPRPRPRPRSMTPNPDAQNGNDAQPGSPPKSPETADSPSPRSSSGAGHQFRIPAKGKGPDGSDQAALLANVIRKSNTPRQVEEIETPDSTGTTYW